MALVIPTTLANGNVIDAPELNANFQAVATHVNGANVGVANMATPYTLIPFTFTFPGAFKIGRAHV